MPDNNWCRNFNDLTHTNHLCSVADAATRRQAHKSQRNIARRHQAAAMRSHVRLVALDASLITACTMALVAMIAYVL